MLSTAITVLENDTYIWRVCIICNYEFMFSRICWAWLVGIPAGFTHLGEICLFFHHEIACSGRIYYTVSCSICENLILFIVSVCTVLMYSHNKYHFPLFFSCMLNIAILRVYHMCSTTPYISQLITFITLHPYPAICNFVSINNQESSKNSLRVLRGP